MQSVGINAFKLLKQVYHICSDTTAASIQTSTPPSNDSVLASINHLSNQVSVLISNLLAVQASSDSYLFSEDLSDTDTDSKNSSLCVLSGKPKDFCICLR